MLAACFGCRKKRTAEEEVVVWEGNKVHPKWIPYYATPVPMVKGKKGDAVPSAITQWPRLRFAVENNTIHFQETLPFHPPKRK